MIVNPSTLVHLFDVPPTHDIQPNGIDLRVSKIFKVNTKRTIILCDDDYPNFTSLYRELDAHDDFYLTMGGVYAVEASVSFAIQIPHNIAAIIVGRSTLVRCGALVITGLYDSGYKGTIGAMLFPQISLFLAKNYRFAQIIFMQAAAAHLYKGRYGNGMH